MINDLSGDAFVEEVTTRYGWERRFLLSPTQWRDYSLTHALSWQEVPFADINKSRVPNIRGVYAFIVRHENGYFPRHGFIMYVGITNRTLRARYEEYIRERQRNKRPAVHFMLNAYKDDLYFTFVPVTNPRIDLNEMETSLNDAIFPPVSKMDFSAEMRSVRNAL